MTLDREVAAGGAPLVRVRGGEGPVLAVALHAGHGWRPGLETCFGMSEAERLREEDPQTAAMAPDHVPLLEVLRTRFEVDLNRPRFRAVYQGPEDAWGLKVWEHGLPDHEDRISRAVHDTFYATAFDELSRIAERHERFLVLDVHAYNHRREGAEGPEADPEQNPEVNLGTRRIDRDRWAPVADAFVDGLSGHRFDVRENVKFGGGHFVEWIADTFPEQACPLAIEFKKTYMDEWTGSVDQAKVTRIREAMTSVLGPLTEALGRCG